MHLPLPPLAPLPLCEDVERLGGVVRIPGAYQRDTHIDRDGRKRAPDCVWMDVSHRVEVFNPLDDQDGAQHRVGHRLDLPEEIALDEGVHEVLHGLPLHEDAVADGVVTVLETFQGDRRPEFVQALSDPWRRLPVVDGDRRPRRSKREEVRLPGGCRDGRSRGGNGSGCGAHPLYPRHHRPLPALAHVPERLIRRAFRHQHDDRAAAASPGPTLPLDAPDLWRDGLVKDHHIRRRDVEPLLAHGGRDQAPELALPEPGEARDLLLLREPPLRVPGRLADEPLADNSGSSERIHERLDGVAIGGEDDDPALRVRRKLCLHQFADERSLGVQLLLPAGGGLDETQVSGIGDEALARLAPRDGGPFRAEPVEVVFERLASLSLGERYGVPEFHALGVQRCRGERRWVARPYTLLDLGVQGVQRLHREFVRFRDAEVEFRKVGKTRLHEPPENGDRRL